MKLEDVKVGDRFYRPNAKDFGIMVITRVGSLGVDISWEERKLQYQGSDWLSKVWVENFLGVQWLRVDGQQKKKTSSGATCKGCGNFNEYADDLPNGLCGSCRGYNKMGGFDST